MEEKSIFLPTSFKIFNRLILNSVVFFWALFFAEMGLSGFQIGLLFAVSWITGLLSILPIGFSNDRFRPKQLITLGFSLVFFQFLGISFSPPFLLLLLFFFLGGLGTTLIDTSLDSLFFKIVGKAQAIKRIGTYVGTACLAGNLGMITGGLILNTLPFPLVLKILSLPFFILVFLAFALPPTLSFRFEIFHYRKDLFRPVVLLFMAILFIFAFHYGAETTSYGLFLKENLGLNFLESGLYMGLAAFPLTLAVFFTSRILGRNFSFFSFLKIALFLSGIGHIAMTYPLLLPSFLGRIVHELGDGILLFLIFAKLHRFFPAERMGVSTSSFGFVQIIGGFLGALIFGPIGEKMGYQFPLIITGVLTLGLIFMAYKYQKLAQKT